MAASAAADTLLCKVGSGQLHVSVALEIASAVASDGLTTQRIKTLANMADDSNQERSLHRWLADLHGHNLQLYTIKMLLQPPGKLTPEEVLRKRTSAQDLRDSASARSLVPLRRPPAAPNPPLPWPAGRDFPCACQ